MIKATAQPVGDRGIMLRFGDDISPETHEEVLRADRLITGARPHGFIENIPSFNALMVVYDPLLSDYDTMKDDIFALSSSDSQKATGKEWVIPTCYEAPYSPDLASVAEQTGLSEEAVINAHTGTPLRLYMYGFAPGYAYFGGLDSAIQIPRKPEPVRDRPIGTVMIAGAQTVISSLIMPTGWWMIGRTNFRLFRPGEEEQFPISVGDTIRFERISISDFDASGGAL